jgi:hypothetical protein
MYDFKDEEKYEGSVNGQPRNLQVQQVLLKTILRSQGQVRDQELAD